MATVTTSHENFTNVSESSTVDPVPDWMKCEGPSPNSSELLRRLGELGPGTVGTMCVPPIMLVIMVILFIDEMVFLLRNSLHWRRTVYYLWILGSFPVLSFFNVLGLFIPAASAIVDFASSFFFSIALKKFFGLILHYYGGKQKMVDALKGEAVISSNPFPCCFVCCCCNQPMTLRRINIMQVLAYQAIVFLPTVYFVQSIMAAEGLATTRVGGLIISVIGLMATASSFTALYSFVVMAKSSRVTLQQFWLRWKYLCIQMIVGFNTVQGFTLNVVQRWDGLSCGFPYPDRQRAFVLHSYLLTCELFVLAIVAWFVYKRLEDGCEVVMIEEPPPTFKQVIANSYSSSSDGDTESGSSIPANDEKHGKINGMFDVDQYGEEIV